MFKLTIHPDAENDIDALWDDDADAAAEILVWLQEAQESQAILDTLTDHHFGVGGRALYDISRWQEHYRRGKNLWRAKLAKVRDYRVIYCFMPAPSSTYHVLGIINRDFNYEGNDDRTRRILAAYENL